MKKIICYAAAAVLCLSCTVEKLDTSRRTPEYLVSLASDIISSGCDENVEALASAIKHPLQHPAMWRSGWDTTITASSGRKIHITKTAADSVWTLTSATDGDVIGYNATMKAGKDSLNGKMTWNYKNEGTYSENNGFTSSFSTGEDGVVYSWFQYVSLYDVTYYLVKTGLIETKMYKNGEQLDWVKIQFSGSPTEYQYITSRND